MPEPAKTKLVSSLRFAAGKSVATGVRRRCYWVDKNDIVKWPELPASATSNVNEIATYKGNFELAVEAKWLVLDLVYNKGELKAEAAGEKPFRLFKNSISLAYPEYDETATANARSMVNGDGVFLIQQRDGKFRVVGSEEYEGDVKPSQTTGEGPAGTAGTQFDIEAFDVCPAPYYTGSITTEDGDVNPAPSPEAP